VSYDEKKIQVQLTVRQLTLLDEAVTTMIDCADYSPTDYESDSAYEKCMQEIEEYKALQEWIQYNLS
jgi:hypothetical protein